MQNLPLRSKLLCAVVRLLLFHGKIPYNARAGNISTYKNKVESAERHILKETQTTYTVYPKKYARGFVVLCFVVVMQSFIMNSHEVFIHIHQGCFAGTGAIVRLPQCQWSKPDGYGKISQCITTTKHSKAKTVCIFLWIYCMIFILCIFTQHWMSHYYVAKMKFCVIGDQQGRSNNLGKDYIT